MSYFNDQSPADTDAVKKGASVIRAMKTALNTVVNKIFDDNGNFLSKWITTSQIGDAQVTAPQIADGAVGTDEILDASVTGGKIAAGAVGSGQLADGGVTAGKIAAGAVGSSQLATGAVTSAALAAAAILNAAIAAGAVDRTKIAAGAISQMKIASVVAPDGINNLTFTTGFQPDFVILMGAFGSFGSYIIGLALAAEGSNIHAIQGTLSSGTMTYNSTGFVLNSVFTEGGPTIYGIAFKSQS